MGLLPTKQPHVRQVYKAQLRRDGSLVAVKVQRPGIVEQISLDFYLVRAACQLVDKYVDAVTTPLVPLVDEFAARVYQELNYVQVSARRAILNLPAAVSADHNIIE